MRNEKFIATKKYVNLLKQIKERIGAARIRAALAVNAELIQLYWYIGNQIIEKQKETKWGSKLLESLSKDLRQAFPDTQGFSVRNLERMRQFSSIYSDSIAAQAVSQLPWGHIVLLIQKAKNSEERAWYIEKTVEGGWSRPTLKDQIENKLYKRQKASKDKTSNFLARLPHPHSHLAQDLLKNPYNFDFLGLAQDAYEKEIEHASVQHIAKFLLELGRGFAFIGTQVPLEVGENEYFVDMLFYHLKLHCYVVIELKATAFKAEHAGQLNFYLNVVDEHLRAAEDNKTIGLLLCKERDKVVAEYALKGIEKPIGVSEYKLSKAIPKKLQGNLPSINEIEAELNKKT